MMSLVERLRGLAQPPPVTNVEMQLRGAAVPAPRPLSRTPLAEYLSRYGRASLAERAAQLCTRGPLYERWCKTILALLQGRATPPPADKPPKDIELLILDLALAFPDTQLARYAEKIGVLRRSDTAEAKKRLIELADSMAAILSGHARASFKTATKLAEAIKLFARSDDTLVRALEQQLMKYHVPPRTVKTLTKAIGDMLRGAKQPSDVAKIIVSLSRRSKHVSGRVDVKPPNAIAERDSELNSEASIAYQRLAPATPVIVK